MPRPHQTPYRVGVLSDTHGHLDERVLALFEGVDHVVHAGDVGTACVLIELEAIAPVTVVRGNTDPVFLGIALPDRATPLLGGVRFVVVHDVTVLAGRDLPRDARVVVSGHLHTPSVDSVNGVLYLNPGSVWGPRGPKGPTVALVSIAHGRIQAEILPLEVA
jgi:hypothetical protein